MNKEKTGDLPAGVLFIVATPIGNLEDISRRALRILGDVDIIAAEDTRRTGMLLKAVGLKKPLLSYFAHNEEKQSGRIIDLLKDGKTVALVSDAGMPGISDPGARLVRQAIKAEIRLTVIPGPSAGITALAASGLDTDVYAFGGFFPRTNKEKKDWMDRFCEFPGTVVFYESPMWLRATLQLLKETWGDRGCCIGRELTKRFEEFIRGTISEVYGELAKTETVKGEIVVVVEGYRRQEAVSVSREEAGEWGRALIAAGMGKKEASRELAKKTGISAKECYAILVQDSTG